MNINSYTPDKHKYLKGLASIAQAPERLYFIGHLPEQREVSVAVVGTRSPTAYGTQVAFDLAYKLAQRGIIIISGLAYGIDAAAHQGALAAGGRTIAVMAHGLDMVYPAGHSDLARHIISAGGALLSEYAPGDQPLKYRFLERNRLVSGLADALIVVEAGERSGTSVTVTCALEQDKEVFAVPGPITSPQSVGPNRLIQQGAHPLMRLDDLLAVLKPTSPARTHIYTAEETAIRSALAGGQRGTDALLAATGLTTDMFYSALTSLELRGDISSLGGQTWQLRTS